MESPGSEAGDPVARTAPQQFLIAYAPCPASTEANDAHAAPG
jgi:hypothetical protein